MSAGHRRAVKRRISIVENLEQRTLFAAGVPMPDHVVIVIEENKAASSIIGSASAPYINSLAAGGANFTQSYAIEHPSQPNYLDLFSGSNQGNTNDSIPVGVPFTSANLGALLLAKGLSFAGYSESLPGTGLTDDSTVAGGYRRKHNPWVNWTNTTPGTNQLPTSVNRDFSAFPTDFAQLPTVSFVIPTQYNDMHDDRPNDGLNAIQAGDAWLKANLDAYAQWAKTHNSLLIVTFDEDDSSHNNQISTVFFGQPVRTGTYSETINHFGVLRTIEDMYNLGYAGASATKTPITDAWTTSPVTTKLVAAGSTWKYLDTGVSLDTVNWKSTGYVDTGWKSGPGELGYGDGDEKTTVSYGTNASAKFTTTYFRDSFNVADVTAVGPLTMLLKRDDGAVVYLNGTEVVRSNMPTTAITSSTFASTVIGGTAESTFYSYTISPSLLVNGTNTLAVEVHQSDLTSSDISFDLELSYTAPVPNVAPTITSISDSPDPVAPGGNVTLTANGAADSDGSVASVAFYRETNGTAGLQIGSDLLIGTDTSSTGGYTATFSTAGLAAATYTYYGIVTDNKGAVSPVVSTTHTVNAANAVPTMTSLTDSSDPVSAGTTITLTANGVADSDGTVASVKFYRETNGTYGLQTATDLLVGTDTSSTGGWTAAVSTAGLAATTYTYYAIATDNLGAVSTVRWQDNTVAQNLLPAGSTWKYLDTGVSLDAVNWKTTAYVDTAWKNGAAQLGYGDGDENTVVSYGADPNNKYVTTYFRDSFTLSNTSGINALTLRLLRDDGAVVYLNGSEVVRSNMPTGNITSATFASGTIPAADETKFFSFTVNPALLVVGTNEIAVEVHQSNLTSADVSFDLQLLGTTNTPPTIKSLSDTPDPLTAGGNVTLTANTVADSGGSVAFVRFYRETNGTAGFQANDLLLGTDTSSTGGYTFAFSTTGLSAGTYTYYAQVTDNRGAVSSVVSTTNTVNAAALAATATSTSTTPTATTRSLRSHHWLKDLWSKKRISADLIESLA